MIKLPPTHDNDYLFLVLIHAICEKFENHAILKGGMVLKLLGSNRKTLDLDYTFIPFKSKNEVLTELKNICSSIEDASVNISPNSKAIRIIIKTPMAQAQIEVNVSEKCKSVPISTGELSKNTGLSPQIIRVMSYDVSLANKLAAWFERRLIRDLYDIHFLANLIGASIDMPTLKKRLGNIDSRIPKLKKIKKISIHDFWHELELTAQNLDENDIRDELSALIEEIDLIGLDLKIRKSILTLISRYR